MRKMSILIIIQSTKNKPKSNKAKSKLGNVTERGNNQSKNEGTRRSANKGNLTSRGPNKSSHKNKSGRKSKHSTIGKSKSKSKSKNKFSMSHKKSSQKNKILARAAQYDKQSKLKEKSTLNKMMKIHDNQMKKGYSVLNKRKM